MTEHTGSTLPSIVSFWRFCAVRWPCTTPTRGTIRRLEPVQRPNGDWWLVCADSGYKYPIREGIPVMMIDEGEKWKSTPVEDLPSLADYFKD